MSFFDALRGFGAQTALIEDSGQSLTYAGLAQRADDLAAGIGSERQLVAIECLNRIDSVAGLIAVLSGGHVGLLVDATLDEDLRTALYDVYPVSCRWRPGTDGRYALERCREQAPDMHASLALLLSTSGSTGSPKLVRLTKDNLDRNAASIAEYLGLDRNERPITTLPMSYSYGLSVINSHLRVGATLLLTDQPLTSRQFWDFFRDRQATSFAGVPFTYQVLRRLRLERMELPSLHSFTQAGGRLDKDSVAFFAELAKSRGQRFFVMYGQTEATARISYLPPEQALLHPDSIGRAIPGGQLSLVDDAGQPIEATDTVGELIYSGPNVMLGYAVCADDLQLGDELRGRIATGDLAMRNAGGLYFIRGRKKRFIKIVGNRVGLDEIEVFLAKQGFVCAATGDDNALRVVVEGDGVEQVEALLREHYRFHPSVFKVKSAAALPRNAAGKIQYGDANALFEAAGQVQG